MYLIFDASANGKPKSYKAPHDDTFNWPRLMHLSWIHLDKDLKPTEDYNSLVQPNGWAPAPTALRKHHLEDEKLRASENKIEDVLEQFSNSVGKAEYVFAHNMAYNAGILNSEFYRQSKSSPLIGAESFCLMHEATYFCKLPGKKGYKWPSLQEMHSLLFKQGFSPSGHARADVIAASRCFIYLMKAGALEDVFDE